jgi:Cu/Ag efflux pump CusA
VLVLRNSFVYVLFEDWYGHVLARSRVLEYLNQVQGPAPGGAGEGFARADATGWVGLQYALVDRAGNTPRPVAPCKTGSSSMS